MKVKSIFKIQLFCLFFLYNSCASSELMSNKSADFNQSISKVYIVLGGKSDAGYFLKSLRYYLFIALKEKGIASKVFLPSALALSNEKTYQSEIEKFKPDVVLFIEVTNVGHNNMHNGQSQMTMGGTQSSWADVDLQMSKPTSDDLVWRGAMRVAGNLFSDKPAKKASKSILQSFIEDGIVK